MSLSTQIQAFVTRVGTEFKSVRTSIASVAAAALRINDAAASTTTVYSASKTDAQIATAVAALVNGAPGALDTLAELATALQADQSAVAAINAALANRLQLDAPQTLTAAQKAQGLSNLGAIAAADVGDVSTDFVAAFNAAIA